MCFFILTGEILFLCRLQKKRKENLITLTHAHSFYQPNYMQWKMVKINRNNLSDEWSFLTRTDKLLKFTI